MPVRKLDATKFAHLVAASLPPQPITGKDNDRLTAILLDLDERDILTAEEKAFAELLAIIIEDFERKHYALPAVAPNESLKALMADRGLRHKDVAPIVGNKGLTTEILSGRRKISIALAKRLAQHFNVPLDLFV